MKAARRGYPAGLPEQVSYTVLAEKILGVGGVDGHYQDVEYMEHKACIENLLRQVP
jgi:hypothetical protein